MTVNYNGKSFITFAPGLHFDCPAFVFHRQSSQVMFWIPTRQVFDMADARWQMKGSYEPWYIGWANCDDEVNKPS
jgi:hypothetical protein